MNEDAEVLLLALLLFAPFFYLLIKGVYRLNAYGESLKECERRELDRTSW